MGLKEPGEIGVRELRQNAGKYLAWVNQGHELIVTNHGKPAAKLVPIDDTSGDRIQAKIRSGRLLAPEVAGDPMDIPIVVPTSPVRSSQEILDELREDRV
jgi:prevent-host-death family protein